MDQDDHGLDIECAVGNARKRIGAALDDMSIECVKDLVVLLETNGRELYQGLHFDVFRSGSSTFWNWKIGDICPLEGARWHAPSRSLAIAQARNWIDQFAPWKGAYDNGPS